MGELLATGKISEAENLVSTKDEKLSFPSIFVLIDFYLDQNNLEKAKRWFSLITTREMKYIPQELQRKLEDNNFALRATSEHCFSGNTKTDISNTIKTYFHPSIFDKE